MHAQSDRTRKGRPRPPTLKTLPDDLYDYADDPAPRTRRSRGDSSSDVAAGDTPIVTDDWPDDVPVTEAEIDVFERYFGDVLDRLLAPTGSPENGLNTLSLSDNDKP